MSAPAPVRRSQAERRTETIGRLVEATIGALVEVGYASTSTGEVCRRSGVSQGGLFRHFASRVQLIGAATDEIGRRHLEHLDVARAGFGRAADPVRALVLFCRDACREPVSAAWHEVMVAARTDDALRDAVLEPLRRFEAGLIEAATELLPAADPERAAALILSVLHMFDSEAVTTAVLTNPAVEAARIELVTDWLGQELSRVD